MSYSVVVLFISLLLFKQAYAQGLDLSPPGLANQTAATISCMGSPLFVFALLSIPVVFTAFYFASYLNIEKRSRQEEKGSFFSDELLVLMISSFIVAAIIHLVYLFWEFHGIPVKFLFSKYFFCDESGSFSNRCGLFIPEDMVLPQTCQQVYVASQPGFASAFAILLTVGTFFYKVILVFVPVFSSFVLNAKNAFGAIRDVRERRYNARHAAFVFFFDAIVITMAVIFYYGIIYSILLVPWVSLVQWFLDASRQTITELGF